MGFPLHLALSTCPNDTFAFHALLENKLPTGDLDLSFELLDIQQLNSGLREGRFDVAKASFFAALDMTDRYLVLRSGSALGFGVGPLLLAATPGTRPADGAPSTTWCPGADTTATLLFRSFYGPGPRIRQVEFSEIMPALQRREADFGVCIHEGRFTWQQVGLALVEDLGERWERETGAPLPLGGILARRDLPPGVLGQIQSLIRDSIAYGMDHREETLVTMRRYAQELNDEVLYQHVDLYVNDWTVDMGEAGRQALDALSGIARRSGLIQDNRPPLLILDAR